MTLRTLAPADLPALLALSECAGWNQTEADWRLLLALAPATCFGVEAGGVIVSSATLLPYGDSLAWLGMVLTLTEHRGRGYATALLARCLEAVDNGGIRCVKLDATAQGEPLYRKLGFVDEVSVERWRRDPAPLSSAAPDLPPGWLADLDRAAFGADRTALLESLSQAQSAATPTGFAFARPGRVAAFFGPCLAQDSSTAAMLLRWFLARHGHEPCFWDFFPGHAAARALAAANGFRPVRRLLRMARGPSPAWRMDPQFALAGFELG